MSARPYDFPKMTEAEYLEFEETSEIRHEFVTGNIFAITGASYRHNVINGNLIVAIGSKIVKKDAKFHQVIRA